MLARPSYFTLLKEQKTKQLDAPQAERWGKITAWPGQGKGDNTEETEGEASLLLPATVKPLSGSAAHGNLPKALIIMRLPYFNSSGADGATPE